MSRAKACHYSVPDQQLHLQDAVNWRLSAMYNMFSQTYHQEAMRLLILGQKAMVLVQVPLKAAVELSQAW